MEQIDENEQQATELELFSFIVRAPLQILDLDIPDPALFSLKSSAEGQDYVLSVILRNFSGTQLKLSNVIIETGTPVGEFDFDWACMGTLRYFKLFMPKNISTHMMEVVARKLSQMPNLKKVKFDQLWTYKQKPSFGDKSPKVDPFEMSQDWINALNSSRSLR